MTRFCLILAIVLITSSTLIVAKPFFATKQNFKEISPQYKDQLIFLLRHPKVVKKHKVRIALFLLQRRYFRCLRKFHWISICYATCHIHYLSHHLCYPSGWDSIRITNTILEVCSSISKEEKDTSRGDVKVNQKKYISTLQHSPLIEVLAYELYNHQVTLVIVSCTKLITI